MPPQRNQPYAPSRCVNDRTARKYGGEGPRGDSVHNRRARYSSIALATFLLSSTALIAPTLAAERDWTGAVNDDWFTAGNWNPNYVPTASGRANINGPRQSIIEGKSTTIDYTRIGIDKGLGNGQSGSLLIRNGGQLHDTSGFIGYTAGFKGTATVTGKDSLWSNGTNLRIGYFSEGWLTISDGGSAIASTTYVGSNNAARGILSIESGGSLFDTNGYIGYAANATGTATVTGKGSQWINTGNLGVGHTGNGTLRIESGGVLSSTSGYIGSNVDSTGTATVTGAGSQWTSSGNLWVGSAGNGVLTVSDGGSVSTANAFVGFGAGSSGTINIGAASGDLAAAAGTLTANSLAFGDGAGTLVFNHTSNDYLFSPAMSGAGNLKVENGRTVLAGNSSGFGGNTTILSGATLQVGDGTTNGAFASSIANSGVLTFNRTDTTTFAGTISGSGMVQQIGAGTTVLTGANNYGGDTTVSSGTLQFGDGSAGGSNSLGGKLDVTGGTLAIQTPATLNVAQSVTFADNTALSIIAKPNGPSLSADSVTLGNGVAFNLGGIDNPGQLDRVLIDTTSGINGDFGAVTVGGFSGPVDYLTLSTHKSADNLQYLATYGLSWTANNNLAHGTFTLTNPSDSFEVGTALNDQVANAATGWNGSSLTKAGAGTLILSGANTYTGGTTIGGGTLQLGNGGTTGSIMGDVTNNGVLAFNRSDATTFAGAISGTGAVQQIGTGTTVLTGINSYGGGTELRGGTLQVSADANLGAASGALTFLGGVLSSTANFDMARSVTLTQAGRFDIATGTTLGLTGVVSGSGDLVKQGNGTLRLDNGANAYGNTQVMAGTLVGNAGSIAGNIGNAGTVVFDQGTDASFAGTLSGSGSFIKTGTGKLDLTGTSAAFTGTNLIEAGTLAVNGELRGSLDVGSAGRLQGNGTVGNTVISGTVAPGNSIGTLHVAGNAAFNPGSIYEVEIDAAGQSDRIIASGTAAIGGGSVKALAGAGHYAPQTRYTILTATAGRTGAFDGVTSNLAFLDPSLSYDATNVYLTMRRNDITFAGIGLTPNQIAAGGGVESLGWGSPVYGAAVNLSADQARAAFDQLSGEIHASAKTALIEDSRFLRDAVNDRIRAAFDGVGASNGMVTSYADGNPQAVAANTDRVAVWGRGFGSWGLTGSDGNAARLNRSTGGFFIGADAAAFDTWRFGMVAGYSQTSFDARDRQSSGTSDNYHLGLYGGTQWGNLAFRTGAAYTLHDMATNRSVAFPGFSDRLNGDYQAGTAQVFGELGYTIGMGAVRFEPFANLAYVNLHTDGFTEKGGSAALISGSMNTDTTFATLGLRGSTAFDLAGARVTAKGMIGWRHAFGDVMPLSTMRFASAGNAFSIGGVPIARNAAVIEAGLDLALSPNAALGVSYGGQFGAGFSDQSVRASFNMKF
jgi:outer membrane autotransporter protein